MQCETQFNNVRFCFYLRKLQRRQCTHQTKSRNIENQIRKSNEERRIRRKKNTQTINDVFTHTQCKINYTDTALNEIICRPLHTN